MAAAAVRHALRLPGRLVKNPTDLSTSFPYGGTALGMVKSMRFKMTGPVGVIEAEELAAVVEVIQAGYGGEFSGVLRGFDNDAISTMFPDTAAGGTSGDRVIYGRPNTTSPGQKLSASAHKLLFVPDAPLRHPAVYLPNAIPVISQEVELPMAQGVEVALAVMWYARPDDSAVSWAVGKLKDLTL